MSAIQSGSINWSSAAPYITPPLAAALSIIPVFRGMIVKSFQQLGESPPQINVFEGVKKGIKVSPVVGVLVGTQMVIQNIVEKRLLNTREESFATAFVSSAIVGVFSSPVVAVYNGKTLGNSIRTSLRQFTVKQATAISIQESMFVAGLSMAAPLTHAMRKEWGESPIVDYSASFISGAMGSLLGHPANTALTRWQNNMKVENIKQVMWGSLTKAKAVGLFAVFYRAVSEAVKGEG